MKLLASLAIGFAGLVSAQPNSPIERPPVQVGDRWTYQRYDYATGQRRGAYEMQVVFAARGVIQVVSSRKDKTDELDTTFTHDWNAVSTTSRVFNPHTGWLRFPLEAGAKYQASYEAVHLKKQFKFRNQRQVRVLGWEEVQVPAGKFRALKIVSEGRFERAGTVAQGTASDVIWYVPEVRRWVKITSDLQPLGRKGRGEHSGEELVAYELK